MVVAEREAAVAAVVVVAPCVTQAVMLQWELQGALRQAVPWKGPLVVPWGKRPGGRLHVFRLPGEGVWASGSG